MSNVETVTMNADAPSLDEATLANFRQWYVDRHGTLTTLNAVQIETMLNATSDADAAILTPEQWADKMLEVEKAIADDDDVSGVDDDNDDDAGDGKTTIPTVSSFDDDAMVTAAKTFGSKLGEGLSTVVLDIAEADEKSKRGVAIILHYLEKKLSKEDWDNVPDPSLKRTKENAEEIGNRLVSKWQYKDGNRNRSHDWYEIAISQLPKIAALKQAIEDISAPDSNSFVAVNPQQEQYARWGKSRRAAEYTTLSTRYRNIVLRFRRAVALRNKIAACNEVPNVACGLRVDKDDKKNVIGVTKQIACLFVRKRLIVDQADNTVDESDEPVYESLTIGTFMRLKPEDENVTDYDSLMKTKDRPPQTPEGNFKAPTGTEEYLGAWNVLGHFVGEKNNRDMFMKDFARMPAKEQLIVARNFQTVYLDSTTLYNVLLPVIERAEAVERNVRKNAGLATRKAS